MGANARYRTTPVEDTADEIYELLRALPGPRDAARAIAIAHVQLIESAGGDTEERVTTMLNEMTAAILTRWRAGRGVHQ